MPGKPSVIAIALVGALCIVGILLRIIIPDGDDSKPGDPSVVKASENPAVEWKRSNAEPPIKKVSQNTLAVYYPVGKTVRSISYLNMTGEGTNTNWILKGTTHFAYQYRIAAETKVKDNRGTRLVFEQHFKEVMQTRAENKQELELNPPNLSASPIITLVWSELEQHVLSNVPVYGLAKTLAEIANGADPNLKWTLTQLSTFEWLKRAGHVALPSNSDPLPIAIKVSQLQGQRVEIEYVSELGVTYIKVLDGKQVDHDLLEHLAYRSSVLMDYVIGEGAKADVGKPFSVPFKQIRGLCGLEYDIDGEGELLLRKDPAASPASQGLTRLTITGGTVTVSGVAQGVQRTGAIQPATQSTSDQNYVLYSEKSRLVRRAMANWDANFNWFTEDSLLFGTRNLRHVRMTSYYEAEIAP